MTSTVSQSLATTTTTTSSSSRKNILNTFTATTTATCTPPRTSGTVSPLDFCITSNTTIIPNNAAADPLDPIELLTKLESLPEPLHPSNCPLLCCFYSEFDNTVGPMVCFESPRGFMSRDVGITSLEAQHSLSKLFFKVKARQCQAQQNSGEGYTDDNDDTSNNDDNNQKVTSHSHSTNSSSSSCSIFDATSDYIITGSDLADQIICVSTRHVHVMTMSTTISDARYERNSLLFSVGFVIRREEDIVWPFRGPLSTIVSTFKTMELESQFLSSYNKRQRIQSILESILISLNTPNAEANLLLDASNQLNLKLFRPPRTLAHRVPDYVVPILLVPEWQLQMFDWDLTINWIIPHIDGIKNSRLIAQESEMDDEMCAACLRVLKHHCVIDFCDIFRYSNVYESTPLASTLLAELTQHADVNNNNGSSLLDLACYYSCKTPAISATSGTTTATALSSSPLGLDLSQSDSNTNKARRAILLNSLSSPPLLQQQQYHLGTKLSSSPLFHHHLSTNTFVAASFPPSQPTPLDPIASYESLSHQHNNNHARNYLAKEQHGKLKTILAHLYSSCTRNKSFGDVLLSKLEEESDNNSASATAIEGDKEVIDWKVCFELIDHRRFITFGIIHGLIRRVHCFPFAHHYHSATSPAADDINQEDGENKHCENDVPRALSSSAGTSSPFGIDDDDIDEITVIDEGNEDDDNNHIMIHSDEKDPIVDLANRVAESMDGTKCDDELTCIFSLTLPELVDVVDTYTDQTVSFVYSTMRFF